MLKVLLLISLGVLCAFAIEGVDISAFQGAPSQSVFDCFRKNGKEFAMIQVWQGGYGINKNFVGNYKKAKAAGIKHVDAYAFICNNCHGNTASNICESIKKTLPHGFDGKLWLDIEYCSGCWTGTSSSRLKFVESVKDSCNNHGIHIGIYSGSGSWSQVFGSTHFDGGSLKSHPLWYAHYDGSPHRSDWGSIKFGGWKEPAIKQYQGTTNFCGTTVDKSAY